MRTGIISCVKCEERYIREWIEWHLGLGFGHFFLADNNERQHTPTLESVVRDYIEKGVVTIIDCSGMVPVQPRCYNMIMDEYGDDYDWYAMIDVDEFFCLPKHKDIQSFLSGFDDKTDIIHLHWRYYDDNDLLAYDDRPVQQRFTRPVNKGLIKNGFSPYIKSMFRNKVHIESKTGRPFVIDDQHCVLKDITISRRTASGEEIQNPVGFTINYSEEEIEQAYIKHFITKTVEEYIDKRNRGDSYRKDGNNSKYSEKFFFSFNEVSEEKIEYIRKHLI